MAQGTLHEETLEWRQKIVVINRAEGLIVERPSICLVRNHNGSARLEVPDAEVARIGIPDEVPRTMALSHSGIVVQRNGHILCGEDAVLVGVVERCEFDGGFGGGTVVPSAEENETLTSMKDTVSGLLHPHLVKLRICPHLS